MPPVSIVPVDYLDPLHTRSLRALMNAYACDPMGGGEALPEASLDALPAALANVPGAFSLLAFVGEEPVGLVNCFMGFSTFAVKPLINIHDLVVVSAYRGHGIAHRLLDAVAEHGRERNCCKLTLEVLSNNVRAVRVYEANGFAPYQLTSEAGPAQFWQRRL